jgi:hypothetical protein
VTEESRTADLEARLERLEGQASSDASTRPKEQRKRWQGSGAETALWSLLRTVFPEETRRHMRAATREQLLAARSYIDHWLERLEGKEQPAPEPGREEISIE